MENRNFLKIVKIGIVILCILLTMPFLNKFDSKLEVNIIDSEQHVKTPKTGNIDESPILIDAEATGINAHNWSWAVSQDWCNGSGTEIDPYRISQVSINGMGVNNCIEIRNSKNDYFMIDHCNFLNAGNADPFQLAANLFLNNSKYGKIILNEIIGASSNLAMGLYAENCSYLQIESNNVSENRFNAIQLSHSFASNITNNLIYNNHYGGISVVDGSQTIHITNNLVDQNYDGIGISDGSYNWINNNTISNNILDGIICVNCYNVEIASNEITLNKYDGMYIASSNNLNIIANTIENNVYGIILRYSDSNSLWDNIIIHNNYYPVWLYSSNYNRILGNTITENKETLTQIDCIGNELIDNIIFNDPEQQFLIITITAIVFLLLVSIIIFWKWKKAKRD
ncbi:MAG: hypothetical protein EU531_03635 [Promethearchaeota archaeon]|nr:MAG: hypothetical protein EU531_03635 [Candidatus Lokiarchaeota archaeon]